MNESGVSPRRSLLDLAPLELDCMNTLWPMGQGTVREIRDSLAARRPRAYTTIMTIMDRLARKGVVQRCKSGRAYVYRPNLSAEDARAQAIGQVVEGFFGGSKEALLAQLGEESSSFAAGGSVARVALSRAAAATAGSGPGSIEPALAAPAAASETQYSTVRSPLREMTVPAEPTGDERIDDTLL
ncbi:MAG: BlaI/MecI/CopY family transcriptional regulator [Candidatus Acidiferrales bacterium]